ncbi:D-hexose-6-phosphate mutarotase [Pseudomonas sp. M30-35]|uniref:D-hexose-6-phosphate mutarotase n=1 Tax=Pseudomonas sp. M30-35 TaxID=1981174 RepID=UPI000B3C9523|nr:D-hexose-6-phosphate mutarotase [Pseudomonas sp. M30-35]ARU90442.1 D-hexose-6-phosphate mutarotase [Pseudomonas sp. M30-35]
MSIASVEPTKSGSLDCWSLSFNNSKLLIAEQGAQILSYTHDDEPPIIWLSQQAELEPGTSVRGGVPVCWPWFGDLLRNPQTVQAMYQQPHQAPAHGLVRSIDWSLVGVEQQEQAVAITFSYNTLEQPLEHWPHAAELTLRVRLGERLSISLMCRNLSQQPLVFSQALHSYFAVSDIKQVSVEGLQDCDYIETLEDWQTRTQSGALHFSGETDRIYLKPAAKLQIIDPLWQRTINLLSSGSQSAVVWNPWVAKAQRLSQFDSAAWQQMLCIEHANVLDDVVTLAPAAEHELYIDIWVEKPTTNQTLV